MPRFATVLVLTACGLAGCKHKTGPGGNPGKRARPRCGRTIAVEPALDAAFKAVATAMEKGDETAVRALSTHPRGNYWPLERLLRTDADRVKRLKRVGAIWKKSGVCWYRRQSDFVTGLIGPPKPSMTGVCFAKVKGRWMFCGWAPGV